VGRNTDYAALTPPCFRPRMLWRTSISPGVRTVEQAKGDAPRTSLAQDRSGLRTRAGMPAAPLGRSGSGFGDLVSACVRNLPSILSSTQHSESTAFCEVPAVRTGRCLVRTPRMPPQLGPGCRCDGSPNCIYVVSQNSGNRSQVNPLAASFLFYRQAGLGLVEHTRPEWAHAVEWTPDVLTDFLSGGLTTPTSIA
jgi:hypothetical protein